MDSASPPGYEALTLEEFSRAVGAPAPTPASGSVCAVAVSLAAGLCAKCARLSSRQMSDATEVAEHADSYAGWAAALANTDALAYEAVIGAPDTATRAEALSEAANAPRDVAKVAFYVAEIAARLAAVGNPNLLGDALTATQLCASAARSAATLVAINLQDRPLDPRRADADDSARAAEALCAEAFASWRS